MLLGCARRTVVKIPVGGKVTIPDIPKRPELEEFKVLKGGKIYKANSLGAVCFSNKQYNKHIQHVDDLRSWINRMSEKLIKHNEDVDRAIQEMVNK